MIVAPLDVFSPHGVVRGSEFLDRQEDTRRLREQVLHHTNTLLVAPRRFGKTSLIHEVLGQIGNRAICVYVDLFTTTSDREVAESILNAAHEATQTRTRKAMDWAKEFLVKLDVVFVVDAKIARLEIRNHRGDESDDLACTLESLEKLAKKRDRPLIVALDEFQRVLERRDSRKTLAVMRGVIQEQSNVTYILSGSKKDVLLGLAADHANPFYQQLAVMELSGIPLAEFIPAATARFTRHGIQVQDDAWERIAFWARENPKRTQDLLQALLIEGRNITPGLVDDIARVQIDSVSHALRSTLDGLATNQMRLLKGLAAEPDETAIGIYETKFLQRTRLDAPGNAQRAIEGLIDKGILDREHRFTDPYLKHHLA